MDNKKIKNYIAVMSGLQCFGFIMCFNILSRILNNTGFSFGFSLSLFLIFGSINLILVSILEKKDIILKKVLIFNILGNLIFIILLNIYSNDYMLNTAIILVLLSASLCLLLPMIKILEVM